MFKNSLDIRRCGSAAFDLCMVAAGRAEAYVEFLLSPWDFAAGMLIVQEAGGVITKPDGSPLTLTAKCPVLAGNPIAYRETADLLSNR